MFLKKLNKDKIRREVVHKYEIKLKVLKVILYFNLAHIMSYVLYIKYFQQQRDSYFSRINNMCVITGRQSGVYKIFKISRIQLRDSTNKLFGIRKSSW